MRIVDYNGGTFERECVLLLGYFDGVHVGHRALILRARSLAESAGLNVGIMTFYDSKKGGQIYDFSERCRLFSSLGVDFVYAAHFDEAFRATGGEEFLAHVCSALRVSAFVCGSDFTFGKDALCGVSALRAFGSSNNIKVIVEKLIEFGGEKAAATRVKQYMDEGDCAALAALLGGRYFICGRVSTEGRHVGRKIGFPTANLHPNPDKYPLKRGVYAVTAEIGGAFYRGIANYGGRPTFSDERVVLEVYADGYSGDLYGKEITVYFDFYIRDIKKFAGEAELSAQLQRDLEKIR